MSAPHIVTYSWDPAAIDQVTAIYPEHRAHVDRLGAQGGLWLTGTLDDEHALAIFHTEEAARAFLTTARTSGSVDEPAPPTSERYSIRLGHTPTARTGLAFQRMRAGYA